MRGPISRRAGLLGAAAVVSACGLSQVGSLLPGSTDGGSARDGQTPRTDGGESDATLDAPRDDAPLHTTGDAPSNDAPNHDGSAMDAGPDSGCPVTSGPTMVSVGAFCVDSTEVTQAQYGQFVEAGVSAATQPTFCSWNTSYTPTGQWPPSATTLDVPVTSVDWCDAYAYCAWAGKRMCGQIGGGPVAPSVDNDAGASQWLYACTHDGQFVYPYGNTYGPTTCNGIDANGGAQTVEASDAFPACVGGYPGIYDMSGNVREWEDSCSGMTGQNDMCNERGGSVNNGQGNLMCATPQINPRSDQNDHLGIRCCAP
jgi:sulfatase modifying factor 1